MKLPRVRRCWLAFVLSTTALTAGGVDGKISGTVVDNRGMPVKHLILDYEQLDGRWMRSGQVPMIETDENGHFSINISVTRLEDGTLENGRWAIWPHVDHLNKRSYYVNQFNRFYHIGHAPGINVTPEAPNAVVEIKLDPKGGALMGKITDAATGAPINNSYMELVWTSDPTRGMGGGMGDNYRWLVPADTPITLKVEAKGYKPEEYLDMTVGSGQDRVLDIHLKAEDK